MNHTMSQRVKVKKPPKKPSNKPSRPLTAYNYFFHDERQRLQERLFKANGQRPTYTQISRLVGASWKKISPDNKAYYDTLAMKDKRRYALELVEMKSMQEGQANSSTKASLRLPVSAPHITLEKKDGNEFASLSASFLTCPSFSLAPSGVDPNSASFQAMLRQSPGNNNHTLDPLPCVPGGPSSDMAAQMALLSVMMIEYVRKVAPERIGGEGTPALLPPSAASLQLEDAPTTTPVVAPVATRHGPTQQLAGGNKAAGPAEAGLFSDDDVQFLGETFGFTDDE